jgi:OOP family OmpA-OmpF porin
MKDNIINPIVTIVVSLMICFVASCAGMKLDVAPIALSENPKELVNRLDNALSNARNNQVNVLSPTWFGNAEGSFSKAKGALDSGGEITRIAESVALGEAQLKRAEEIAELSRTALPDVIKARDLARTAGAPTQVEDYMEVESQFLELTKAIEDNNVGWAQRKKDNVTREFHRLELQAIKVNTIGKVQELIELAEREEAEKQVPRTLHSSKVTYRQAEAYITEHRYEKEELQAKATEALFQAQRLIQLNRQSRQFQAMNPEKLTLWAENILQGITKQLEAPDLGNESFDTQYENIIASIAALKQDHQFTVDKVKEQRAEMDGMQHTIALLEGRTREEQAEKERLAAEKKFQQLFNEVQSFFELEEAEVYKQGNQLVLRLRSIQFPVGSYVLMPNNYDVLSKVQRSIRAFGEPDVVIEGHTDSTGSDAVNEQLSQQRAESVRQYLIANESLPNEKIVGVGFGPTRPLASNKTEEGRAINRRIDVVIIPLPSGEM